MGLGGNKMKKYVYLSSTEREVHLMQVSESFDELYQFAIEDFLKDAKEHFDEEDEEYTELASMLSSIKEDKTEGYIEQTSMDCERGISVEFNAGYLNLWSNDRGHFDLYVQPLPEL